MLSVGNMNGLLRINREVMVVRNNKGINIEGNKGVHLQLNSKERVDIRWQARITGVCCDMQSVGCWAL